MQLDLTAVSTVLGLGSVIIGIIDPTVRAMGEFGREATMGQPDESRVEKARVFARETMKKL